MPGTLSIRCQSTPVASRICTGFGEVAAIEPDAVAALCGLKRFDVAPDDNFRPELLGLLEGALGELVAGDARRKTEIVFDARGSASLAACGEALNDKDAKAFRCPVYGGCHACGTGPDDEDIVLLLLGNGPVAESFGHLADGGID